MITILPADNETVGRLAAAENTTLDRAMVMSERGAEQGHMLYAVQGETVLLGRVMCKERLLADGLLRAVLGAARNAGCRMAVSRESADRDFLSGYGFKETGEGLSVSVAGFFSGGCKGCNGNCETCGQA